MSSSLLILRYSLPSWDKRANETKCYCEERPGLQEQIYKHVIIAVQHVVYSTMKHEYPHYELQLVNPVQIQCMSYKQENDECFPLLA